MIYRISGDGYKKLTLQLRYSIFSIDFRSTLINNAELVAQCIYILALNASNFWIDTVLMAHRGRYIIENLAQLDPILGEKIRKLSETHLKCVIN